MSSAQTFTMIIIIVLLILFLVSVYQKFTNAFCKSKKRLDKKTVIVTGGSTGIGLEIAKDLAHRGARVIIACPFENKGLATRKYIQQTTKNENIVFKRLDLGSLESVRNFAADIRKTEDRLDILINNAGVGIPGDFLTADGMHFVMQVNYFGTFQLTLLLLPLLMKSAQPSEPSRILNTSSIAHWFGKVDFSNLNKTGYWYSLKIYGNSKLCLVLFAHELNKRLKGSNVVINCVDPGAVGTNIFMDGHKIIGTVVKGFNSLYKTPRQGAQTALHVALDDKAGEVSGQFFKNCRLSKPAPWANDDGIAKLLWNESLKLVKLNDHELNGGALKCKV